MTIAIATFFLVTILFGVIMVWNFSNNKPVRWPLFVPHGSSALIGTLLLIIDLWQQRRLFSLFFGYTTLVFLAITALLGLLLFYMHQRRGIPRPTFILLHALMALAAMSILTLYLAPLFEMH